MSFFDTTESDPNGSGSDIICLLVASSSAAKSIIQEMAIVRQQHVLFRNSSQYHPLDELVPSEVNDNASEPAYQGATDVVRLALRWSSLKSLKSQDKGFVFGRNHLRADIVCDLKHVSKVHFCIRVGQNSELLLEDLSTNGTILNGRLLRTVDGMRQSDSLATESMICIENRNDAAAIRFKVIVPPDTAVPTPTLDDVNTVDRRTHGVVGRHSGPQAKWDGGAKYYQTGFLGMGGFASVYKMSARNGKRVFAMKEIKKPPSLAAQELPPRLYDELRIMQQSQHPNIVEYIDSHNEDEHFYIIMEFIGGGSLEGYLQTYRVMHEPQVVEMCRQVLSALVYLHSLNITHRDLKPDNLLLVALDPIEIKVADFGLSKLSVDRKSRLKTFCGSPLYCAPEVYPDDLQTEETKRQRVEKRAPRYNSTVDIWSLGVIIWCALCGEHPFVRSSDGTPRALFLSVTTTPLDATPLQQKGLPATCVNLLMQMLQLEPKNRPSASTCLEHPWISEGIEMASDPGRELGIVEAASQPKQLSFRGRCEAPLIDDTESTIAGRNPKRRRMETSIHKDAYLREA